MKRCRRAYPHPCTLGAHLWPEQDPPVRLRTRILLFGGCLVLAVLIVIGGGR